MGRLLSSHSCTSWAAWLQYIGMVVDVPVVWGMRGAAHQRVDGLMALFFRGRVHRHTARADPRHQGGEGVAGTPGACSQVFCHPNQVQLLVCMDKHTYQATRPDHSHHNHHNHHNHHTRLRQVARTLVNFCCAFSGRHAVAWRTRCGSRQLAAGSPAPGMAPSRPYDGCHGAGDALHHSAQRVEVPREGVEGEQH